MATVDDNIRELELRKAKYLIQLDRSLAAEKVGQGDMQVTQTSVMHLEELIDKVENQINRLKNLRPTVVNTKLGM